MLLESLRDWKEPEPATEDDVARCHDRRYIERFRDISGPTWLDPDTVGSDTSYEGAMLSAGAAIEAAQQEAFAIGRPPGHHALPTRAMGFCLFGNVADRRRFAQAELGVERVAIVDWDVHHGNGTQEIFWDDPSVFFASLHRWPFYPGAAGRRSRTRLPERPAPGRVRRRRLPAAFAEWSSRPSRASTPTSCSSRPASTRTSRTLSAMMKVTGHGFLDLARRSAALAPRLAAVLEGGYDLETLPRLVDAALEGFSAA